MESAYVGKRMNPCLTIKDLVELNQEEVQRTTEKAASLDCKAPAASAIFGQQVKALHVSLVSTYRLAAHLAKRAEDVGIKVSVNSIVPFTHRSVADFARAGFTVKGSPSYAEPRPRSSWADCLGEKADGVRHCVKPGLPSKAALV